MDTPSNPGGVNEEALHRIEDRERAKEKRYRISNRDERDRGRDGEGDGRRRSSSWDSPSPRRGGDDDVRGTPSRTPGRMSTNRYSPSPCSLPFLQN